MPPTVPREVPRVLSALDSGACTLHGGFYVPRCELVSHRASPSKFSKHQRWPLAWA